MAGRKGVQAMVVSTKQAVGGGVAENWGGEARRVSEMRRRVLAVTEGRKARRRSCAANRPHVTQKAPCTPSRRRASVCQRVGGEEEHA